MFSNNVQWYAFHNFWSVNEIETPDGRTPYLAGEKKTVINTGVGIATFLQCDLLTSIKKYIRNC